MRRISTIFSIIFILSLAAIQAPIPVQATASSSEPFSGMPLCLPAIYPQTPPDCLALGPAETLTNLAQQGILLPLRALPAVAPARSLIQMTELYARINLDVKQPAPVYATLEDAIANKPSRFIAPGRLRYVAFYQTQTTDKGRFVHLVSGEWMDAAPAAYSVFQGLLLREPPRNSFGWLIDEAASRVAPGLNQDLTKKYYSQYDIVQVYGVKTVDNIDWAQIGLNEWIERRLVRVVTNNPTPPTGISGDRWIEINLQEQTLMVYDKDRLVFATLIASGMAPYYTRPGLFQIYEKKLFETMSGAFEANRSDYYYLEDVPWTMYYDKNRAIHGAYWRAMFGYPQSHGCVNLSPGDSNWLYSWAKLGDWVYVWDPSGKTPTDPALYGDGGA